MHARNFKRYNYAMEEARPEEIMRLVHAQIAPRDIAKTLKKCVVNCLLCEVKVYRQGDGQKEIREWLTHFSEHSKTRKGYRERIKRNLVRSMKKMDKKLSVGEGTERKRN